MVFACDQIFRFAVKERFRLFGRLEKTIARREADIKNTSILVGQELHTYMTAAGIKIEEIKTAEIKTAERQIDVYEASAICAGEQY